MNALIDAALSHTRTVLSVLFVLTIWGITSYINIPKEASPDIPFPLILVEIPHPGISPVDGERLLLKPMEKRLLSISGLKELNAKALEGAAFISLEFDVDFDKDQALIDVREQVDIAKAELPADSEEPVVSELNAALFPVIAVTLSGEIPERKLHDISVELKDKLDSLPGVLNARLTGNREELLEVIVDPAKLEAYNVSQQELINAVTLNNRLVAAGALDTGKGRFSVKVPGLVETAEDVYNLPIKVSGEGVVTLSDLTEIRRTFKDPVGFARYNGSQAIAIQVVKRIGANIIEVAQSVRDTVEQERRFWPEGVETGFILDQSRFIEDALDQLQASILTAVSLVLIVVVAALGIRSGLMVGIAIPSSFLITFLILNQIGITINQMVMFGLVLAVGMLVDGAIVIVEYADRKMAEGQDRKTAYGMAAKRMFWPITSSTMTTLAAFLPMLLWPGLTGKFMSYLPITLIFILGASLFVALIFLPVIGSIIGRTQLQGSSELSALAADDGGSLDNLKGFMGRYVKLISFAVRQPIMIIGAAFAVILIIVSVFSNTKVNTTFFINGDPEFISIIVGARGNLSTEEKRDLTIDVERRLSGIQGIRATYSAIGGITEIAAGPETPPPDDMIARINVEFTSWKERDFSGKDIVRDIRESISDVPGLRIEIREQQDGPPVGKDIQLELSSDFYDVLQSETVRISQYLETIDHLNDLEDSLPLPGIQWELEVDREQAGRFGADIAQIGVMVQLVTNGVLLGEYRPDDAEDEVEIRVRYPYNERNIEQLDRLRIQTIDGLVPISNFVKRVPKPQVNKVDRRDGQKVLFVRASVDKDYTTIEDKVAEIEAWLLQADIDSRVSYKFRGADEESEAAEEFLGGAMLLALFLMALILLTQFNNFYHVALTLLSVIVSTIGVLLGIIITGQNFSVVMTGTGIVALAGIVVNNNIVLIDTFNRLRASGYELYDAIIRTSAQRFRPVLLTTVTTISGLLPMALEVNLDFFERRVSIGGPVAIWWVELSTAVIFGLAFATVVTLLMTPAMLALPEHIRRSTIFKRLRGEKPTMQPAE